MSHQRFTASILGLALCSLATAAFAEGPTPSIAPPGACAEPEPGPELASSGIGSDAPPGGVGGSPADLFEPSGEGDGFAGPGPGGDLAGAPGGNDSSDPGSPPPGTVLTPTPAPTGIVEGITDPLLPAVETGPTPLGEPIDGVSEPLAEPLDPLLEPMLEPVPLVEDSVSTVEGVLGGGL